MLYCNTNNNIPFLPVYLGKPLFLSFFTYIAGSIQEKRGL